MATVKELKALTGRRVTLRLAAAAPGAPAITGRVLGVLEAADGAYVTVEPDRAPGTRRTVHYHHILTASAEPEPPR